IPAILAQTASAIADVSLRIGHPQGRRLVTPPPYLHGDDGIRLVRTVIANGNLQERLLRSRMDVQRAVHEDLGLRFVEDAPQLRRRYAAAAKDACRDALKDDADILGETPAGERHPLAEIAHERLHNRMARREGGWRVGAGDLMARRQIEKM